MEILIDIVVVVIPQHNIIISISMSEIYFFDTIALVNKCHEFYWARQQEIYFF